MRDGHTCGDVADPATLGKGGMDPATPVITREQAWTVFNACQPVDMESTILHIELCHGGVDGKIFDKLWVVVNSPATLAAFNAWHTALGLQPGPLPSQLQGCG
ncbi:MAG: hypothetical protein FWH21_09280 [Kiritimatiellaeota bacterium]|nr:hypothetical protein [Kiritimatiellota bacterium]